MSHYFADVDDGRYNRCGLGTGEGAQEASYEV